MNKLLEDNDYQFSFKEHAIKGELLDRSRMSYAEDCSRVYLSFGPTGWFRSIGSFSCVSGYTKYADVSFSDYNIRYIEI